MMTKNISISELNAGRSLDIMIAEKVMNWNLDAEGHDGPDDPMRWWTDSFGTPRHTMGDVCPEEGWYGFSPSTLIEHAWEVFERAAKLNKHAKWIRAMSWGGLDPQKPYGCQYGEATEIVWAETMPLAICRAALIAWERK